MSRVLRSNKRPKGNLVEKRVWNRAFGGKISWTAHRRQARKKRALLSTIWGRIWYGYMWRCEVCGRPHSERQDYCSNCETKDALRD